MKNIILLFISFYCLTLHCQTPTITINLPPNPTANTAQWGVGSNIFNIFVGGANMGMLVESNIRVTINYNGSIKCGSYTPETAQSSNIINATPKSWIGSNATALLGQDCILAPGNYEISVQFYGFKPGTRNTLLLEKIVPFIIADKSDERCSPPINVNPVNQKIFSDEDLLSVITFNWTPVISAYRGIVTYQLFVWEVEDGQANAQAIYNNQPIIQEEIKGQPRYIARSGIITKRNAKYVWRVIALDTEGKLICKNSQSEPTNFSIEIPKSKSDCLNFEVDYNKSNWNGFYVSNINIAYDVPHGNYLELKDGAGGSFAIDYIDFAGNWLKKSKDGCLCFDYMVDWNADPGILTLPIKAPRLALYKGATVVTVGSATNVGTGIRAGFVGNSSNPDIKDTEWRKFCLPIGLSSGGQLPSNSFGQWTISDGSVSLSGAAASAAWDDLIQNVTGFYLGTDYNSQPSELVNFDNFCWTCDETKPPVECCDMDSKEGCLVIDKEKMTIECDGVDSEGKNIYKISNLILKNTSNKKAKTGISSNTAGTNYVESNPSGAFTIHNLTPASSNSISAGQEINISFEAHQVSGTSLSFFVDGSLISKEEGNCDKHLLVSIDNLPICNTCDYCDDDTKSKIQIGNKTVNVTALNIMTVAQDFNISPLNIKRVTAEIISISEDPITMACMKCINDEDWIYKFISHNTTSWNSGVAFNASPLNSDGYYPVRLVEWNCNNQGALKFNFKIALPGTENGCVRKGKIGIRYSFTDINCNTCEKIIWYNFTSN